MVIHERETRRSRIARSGRAAVPSGRPASGYLPQLDGLRGIAITLVVIHHAIVPLPFGGLIGVDVFFALSGYLITGILLREREKYGTIRLKRFYARRFLRLYPPLLVGVIVVFVPGMLLTVSHWRFAVDTLLALTYTTPIVVLFVHGVSNVWRQTWSLGMEELFYLVWPMLVLLAFRARRWRPVLLTIAVVLGAFFLLTISAAGAAGESIPYILRAGGLFFGCALAVAQHSGRLRAGWPVAALGLALIAVATVLATGDPSQQAYGIILATVGSIGVLAHFGTAGDRPSALVRVFQWRPLVLLGVVSYELYLWHYPLFVLFHEATGLTYINGAWIVVPVALGLAIATHVVLARYVDRWKAKLPY